MNTELQVFTFDTLTGADGMLGALKELQHDDLIELLDAVVVTKDLNNKVEVRQPLEVGPGKGAAFGALTGALVGLLGGPGGVIVGFAAGALTGGATGAAMEAELPEADIKALALDELDPGKSALAVYFDEVWIDQVAQAAEDFDAAVYRQILADQRKAEREARAAVRKEKIDAAYKSWQAKLDQQRASITALQQRASTALQADRDALQKQIAQANARTRGNPPEYPASPSGLAAAKRRRNTRIGSANQAVQCERQSRSGSADRRRQAGASGAPLEGEGNTVFTSQPCQIRGRSFEGTGSSG